METKQKILSAAEKLFFSHGIGNVRLQQIADDTGISVGNLAYHFKNKETIVITVYEKMMEEFQAILSGYMLSPGLADFDRLFSTCHVFFTSNAFYLNNIWEINRSYPDIKSRWEQVNTKMITQLKKRIEFNISTGLLRKAHELQNMDDLAQNLWLTITFWIPQQILLGKKTSLSLYRRVLWGQLIPLFTVAGQKEFKHIMENS
jgi:AcrR family transcriptional regulator